MLAIRRNVHGHGSVAAYPGPCVMMIPSAGKQILRQRVYPSRV